MDIPWEKLAWLAVAPRPWNDAYGRIYTQIYAKPLWFVFWNGGVAGWRKEMSEGYLVRLGVIQANDVLFNGENVAPGPAVVCWFKDPDANTSDAPMAALLGAIGSARESPVPRPDCKPFLDLLDNEDSSFHGVEIPLSLTGGRKACASVKYLAPGELPGGCIPASRILPGFQKGQYTPEVIPRAIYA